MDRISKPWFEKYLNNFIKNDAIGRRIAKRYSQMLSLKNINKNKWTMSKNCFGCLD
jgi:hypothetical protein